MKLNNKLEKRAAGRLIWFGTVLLLIATATLPAAVAGHPGHIDSTGLVDLAGGDDAITIEINLSGKLLSTFAQVDEHLAELVKDIYSIEAVILTLPSKLAAEQAHEAIRSTGTLLKKQGWERIARIKEGADEEVQVLVLSVDDKIEGLVLMTIDGRSGGDLVFINIAGTIDLAALSEIGDAFGLPGLDELEGLE